MIQARFIVYVLSILTFSLSACAPAPRAASAPGAVSSPTAAGPTEEKVTFKSGNLSLEGYLYKPAGDGPFPALVWNHGRETHPDEGTEFDSIAAAFVPQGYIVFAPVRRGQGGSQGESIEDELNEERTRNGEAAAQQLFATLMGTEQLDDQLAGLAYLQSLPIVDANDIAVMGCADGGIQAILGAGSDAGYHAAVAISPASDLWASNEPVRNLLLGTVSRINIPVFFMHPSQDLSKDPGQSLAAELERQGKLGRLQLFTPFGTPDEQTQCFGGPGGVEVWKNDALTFLSQVLP